MNENDIKLALALLEKGCPNCFPLGPGMSPIDHCKDCGGTGKVPLLDPGLVRKPCSWADSHNEYDRGKAHSTYDRRNCTQAAHRPCPGWSASNDEIDWVRALNKTGYDIVFLHNGRAHVELDDPTDLHFIWGHGATLFEAAAQALGVKTKQEA